MKNTLFSKIFITFFLTIFIILSIFIYQAIIHEKRSILDGLISKAKNMSDIFGGHCSREIGFTLRLGGMGSNINDRRNWDSYLVDGEVVKLQPEHGKEMQGFPKNFYLPKSRSKALRLLGNSVAVNAIHAVGKQMISYIDNPDSFKDRD